MQPRSQREAVRCDEREPAGELRGARVGEGEGVRSRAAVVRIAQSSGEFGKVVASAGADREVILFDSTVREGERREE